MQQCAPLSSPAPELVRAGVGEGADQGACAPGRNTQKCKNNFIFLFSFIRKMQHAKNMIFMGEGL